MQDNAPIDFTLKALPRRLHGYSRTERTYLKEQLKSQRSILGVCIFAGHITRYGYLKPFPCYVINDLMALGWDPYVALKYHLIMGKLLRRITEVGKASDSFTKGAVIGYKWEEIHVRVIFQLGSDVPQSNNPKLDTYEILLGNMNGLRWVPAHGKLNAASLGYRPVEGGRENDGTLLYIAQAEYQGVYHPGKASAELDGKLDVLDGPREYC